MNLNSWAVLSYHVAHNIIHMMIARCVARDLHVISPWSVERRFCGRCSEEIVDNSWIATLSAIVIKSWLGFEMLGFCMWHFLALTGGDFLWVLEFPLLNHGWRVSASEIEKLQIIVILALSKSVTELSMSTVWHKISIQCVSLDVHTVAPWPCE